MPGEREPDVGAEWHSRNTLGLNHGGREAHPPAPPRRPPRRSYSPDIAPSVAQQRYSLDVELDSYLASPEDSGHISVYGSEGFQPPPQREYLRYEDFYHVQEQRSRDSLFSGSQFVVPRLPTTVSTGLNFPTQELDGSHATIGTYTGSPYISPPYIGPPYVGQPDIGPPYIGHASQFTGRDQGRSPSPQLGRLWAPQTGARDTSARGTWAHGDSYNHEEAQSQVRNPVGTNGQMQDRQSAAPREGSTSGQRDEAGETRARNPDPGPSPRSGQPWYWELLRTDPRFTTILRRHSSRPSDIQSDPQLIALIREYQSRPPPSQGRSSADRRQPSSEPPHANDACEYPIRPSAENSSDESEINSDVESIEPFQTQRLLSSVDSDCVRDNSHSDDDFDFSLDHYRHIDVERETEDPETEASERQPKTNSWPSLPREMVQTVQRRRVNLIHGNPNEISTLQPRAHAEEQLFVCREVVRLSRLEHLLPVSSMTWTAIGLEIPIQSLFQDFSSTSYPRTSRGSASARSQHREEEKWIDSALEGVMSALRFLRVHRFCDGDYNVILVPRERSQIADLRLIEYQSLNSLAEKWKGEEGAEHVRRVLTTLDNDQAIPESSIQARMRATIRLLALAVVSYTVSHCYDFRDLVWPDHPQTAQSWFEDPDYISFRPRELACLQGDIGGPVWMMGDGNDTPRALSLSLYDYADLWGPLWLSPSSVDGKTEMFAVHTERGMFYRRDDSETSPVGNEVPCHWVRTKPIVPAQCLDWVGAGSPLSLPNGESIPPNPQPMSLDSRFLIGAPDIEVHSRESQHVPKFAAKSERRNYPTYRLPPGKARERKRRTQPGLNANLRCSLDIGDVRNSPAIDYVPVGTAPCTYVPDGYSLQLNGAFHVGIAAQKAYKRLPARTNKDAAVASSKTGLPFHHWVAFLEQPMGLHVSVCTWNARRRSVWDTLKFGFGKVCTHRPSENEGTRRCCMLLGSDTRCEHRVGDPACILGCWGLDMPSGKETAWKERLSKVPNDEQHDDKLRDQKWNQCLDEILPPLLAQLSTTGIDAHGDLRVWWPFSDQPYLAVIPKQSAPWAEMLRDTETVTTFAVFVRECIEYRPEQAVGKGFSKRCQAELWAFGSREGHRRPSPVLKTTLTVSKPEMSIGRCRLFIQNKSLEMLTRISGAGFGVEKDHILPLARRASLNFRNGDSQGQLAVYRPNVTPLVENAKQQAAKLFLKDKDNCNAEELRDTQIDSSYRIQVVIW
jgi:hypothetical protein